MHNGIGNAESAQQDAKEVENRRHHHCQLGLHGPGINDGRDRIGGVVKSVYGFVKQDKDQRR
ncbi:hypothetical protein SDC9_167888 [bioreactor metagenome]|uniref:Uncharacterized protein n=1 Tax=bioreactor metagenome TaxID=1076179 RepID=A0A645G3X4_9ZZZZ